MSSPGAASLVRIEGLQYCYPGVSTPALSDINLTITAGSCFGLLGPNGAGKTTLISLLTGLLFPQQGSIQVAEFSYPNEGRKIKQLSALVPQDYAFYPALTGRENLQFFAGLYEIPSSQIGARLDYCIEVCGLDKVLDQRSSSYSGGIKRRLNLALGLLREPQILYLDEPTVGIDAQSRFFILQAIERLNEGGITIVYTSHYMEEVEQICDEVAIIDYGCVLLQEPVSKLLQGSNQLLVTPKQAPSALILEALGKVVTAEWDGRRLAITPTQQLSVPQLLLELERFGIEIDKFQMGGTRLEQVYLNATRRELRL
jgi:ABC-2 type transport system ATP-binding protein